MKRFFNLNICSLDLPIVLLFIFIFWFNSISAQHNKQVIGYFCSWQWYDRNKLVNPESVDYNMYTTLNYAFLNPLEDGSLMVTDPWADKNLLLGNINWSVAPAGYENVYDLGNPEYHYTNTSLIHHAHVNGLKVLTSLGGYTLSQNFPSIASNPVTRNNFAHWCNESIRIYNTDGIDIDWEYPGYEPNGGTSQDKENFTLLLRAVRDSLNVLENELSKELSLTIAVGAAFNRMKDVEWNEIIGIVDYINLMSYDFYGSWNDVTNHNSPLYYPGFGDSTFNSNSAVRQLIDYYEVPSTMINLGIAFYGRSFKTQGTPDINVATTGAADIVTFSEDEGVPLFYNILLKEGLFEKSWDNSAMVPYLTGVDGLNTFVSYDDERSISKKAAFVNQNKLAGVIIWEISGDYVETTPGSGIIQGTPLADTLNKTLDIEFSSISEAADYKISIFPNPCNNRFMIKTGNRDPISGIMIYDLMGQILYRSDEYSQYIDIDFLPPGLYTVHVISEKKRSVQKLLKK